MIVKILKPMHDREGRKYMEVDIGSGETRTVKIPWRYNRVPSSVKIEGLRPVQDFREGEMINAEMSRKIWNGQGHWILTAIKD
jgi:hypothetical protein